MLGRDDIGHLAPSMAAHIIAFDTTAIGFAGAGHDPVAALVFCAPASASFSMIDGRVVRDGKFVNLDLPRMLERHNRLAETLVRGEH